MFMRKLSANGVTSVVGVMALALVLAGCGGSSGYGTDDDPSQQFGTMTLGITDAAVDDAAKVVVEFMGVEIKAAAEGSPEVFDFDSPRQIDLLSLEGGASEILLEDVTLPAGAYEWIRLKVNAGRDASDSFVELDDGTVHALFIPSGDETGLKLVRGFTVGAGGSVDFTIDFDLRKSVIKPPGLGGLYLLKPALRLVDNLEVGTIEGQVATSIATAEGCTPVVYVYEGSGVTPDDLGSDAGPLVTARVRMEDGSGEFRYRAAFLPAGPYTVALTCDAEADVADEDNEITFIDPQDTTVTAGQTTTVDFLAAE